MYFNKNYIWFAAIFITLLFGCEENEEKTILDPKTIALPTYSQTLISSNNNFGIALFKSVCLDENDNLMISPLSASTALTMLLNGCSSNTYTQIQQMLDYGNLSITDVNLTYQKLVSQLLEADPKVKINLANAVFYRTGFEVKAPYLYTMEEVFDCHIEGLDFSMSSALTTINGWANDNTNGKIPKVLSEISTDAVMFLMNALYFKGNWSYEFDKTKTENAIFTKSDGNSVSVRMMSGEIKGKVFSDENLITIELPYGRTNFVMDLVVPSNDLETMINVLDEAEWQTITSGLDNKSEYGKLTLTMPKFKFEFEKNLNVQLQSLGMEDAFNPILADLSGISDDDIYVNFVKQNTFVDVNEEGTEAAAVTTIGIDVTSMPNSYFINKPFVFAIRERTTNTLLFIGKVENPVY